MVNVHHGAAAAHKRVFFTLKPTTTPIMPTVVTSYYDPNASRMRANTLEDFLRAPLTGCLQEVPGVGKDTETRLHQANVRTTQQLMGVYLQHADTNAFYHWLQSLGVRAHRNTVVRCVSEKAARMWEPANSEQPPVRAAGRQVTTTCTTIVEERAEVTLPPVPLPLPPRQNKTAKKNARKRAAKKAKTASK